MWQSNRSKRIQAENLKIATKELNVLDKAKRKEYAEIPTLQIGHCFIDTGVKYYPIMRKYFKKGCIYSTGIRSINQHAIAPRIRYTVVEYFTTREEVEEFINNTSIEEAFALIPALKIERKQHAQTRFE